jgi:hypothetical protein
VIAIAIAIYYLNTKITTQKIKQFGATIANFFRFKDHSGPNFSPRSSGKCQIVTQLGHGCFLPDPFLLIIHESSYSLLPTLSY